MISSLTKIYRYTEIISHFTRLYHISSPHVPPAVGVCSAAPRCVVPHHRMLDVLGGEAKLLFDLASEPLGHWFHQDHLNSLIYIILYNHLNLFLSLVGIVWNCMELYGIVFVVV
jgi:hypothetical protein